MVSPDARPASGRMIPRFNPRALALLEQTDPDAFAAFMTALDAEAQDAERELYEGSLLEFFKRAWQEIESSPLSIAWFHEEICAHLEAITKGQLRDLIVNIPPRHTKSLLCNVFWPAWCWTRSEKLPLSGPHVKFLCVSYGATLAETIALRMLRLVSGHWYQSLWGDRVQIMSDQSSRAHFANAAGGERISASIESGLIGRGGDVQICFPYYETVFTEHGVLFIGDIVGSCQDINVWSISASGYLELQPVIGRHKNPGSRILRFELDDGSSLSCTPDHKILTNRGWREARNLTPDDSIWTAGIDQSSLDERDSLSADVINLSQRPIPGATNANLADLIAVKFGHTVGWSCRAAGNNNFRRPGSPDGDAVGLLHGTKISPLASFLPSYIPDGLDLDAQSLRKRPRGFGAFENFEHLGFGQFCGTSSLTERELSVAECVIDIFLPSAPRQTGQPRLPFTPIDMSNLASGWWRAKECERNNSVDLHRESFVVSPQFHGGIAFVADVDGEHLSLEIPAPSADAREAVNATKIRNLIPLETRNGKPRLIRIVSITDVGHADDTYCLTVTRNGTMICGSCQAVVANCDDPHSLEGAESDTQREATLRAISEGLPTRITDPRISARVLVMQRLSMSDATAWCLENWRRDQVHLMYPAHFDPDRACPTDHRTSRGELLWPEMWTEEAVTQATKEMSEYAKAGQFEQMPVPRGGGIIKREWIKPWPDLGQDGNFPVGAVINGRIQYPAFEYIVAAVDTAFTDKVQNDPCALTCWGVFRSEGKGRIERRPDGTYERIADDYGFPKVMLIYGWEKHLTMHGPPEEIPYGVSQKEWHSPLLREERQKSWGLVEWVTDTCRRYKVDHLVIETQAAGLLLESELRTLHSDGDWGVEVIPARGSKLWRLEAISHMFSNGQIYAPAYGDNTNPSWCTPILDQLCLYPRSKRDDFVDTVSAALAHLRSIGLFARKEEFEAEEEHIQEYERNRQVPLPYELG